MPGQSRQLVQMPENFCCAWFLLLARASPHNCSSRDNGQLAVCTLRGVAELGPWAGHWPGLPCPGTGTGKFQLNEIVESNRIVIAMSRLMYFERSHLANVIIKGDKCQCLV